MTRPFPPQALIEYGGPSFVPAPELAAWAETTFIDDDASLSNEDHAHLRSAKIGFLWTSIENTRRGLSVIGQAETGQPQGTMGKWPRARAEQQIENWFGSVPDFIITIDANWWLQAGDPEACALIEHELYHCAQEKDEFGAPRFSKSTGLPVFGMRGHDVEQFVGVVARYGASASGVQQMVEAAKRGPSVAAAEISGACGTCLARAA